MLLAESGVDKAVADDGTFRDDEAAEIDLHFRHSSSGAVEQRGDSQRRGIQALDSLRDDVDGEAGVDDVLDEQHVAADERSVDHVRKPELAAARRSTVIARRADELELGGEGEAAQQVRGKGPRAL